ncbi:MAG: hypothetical protein EBT57_10330 [Verrucomicrobia bacterium]|nr:hypothetical protein [Verrucomicrobiota bacterium]
MDKSRWFWVKCFPTRFEIARSNQIILRSMNFSKSYKIFFFNILSSPPPPWSMTFYRICLEI